MRGEGEVLLVSTYELGHQPPGIASPAAFLDRAGFRPASLDLSVEPFHDARVRAARLVAISVPMHTALRLGIDAAARVRAVNPAAVLAFHGTYAPLHAPLLLEAGASAVLGGECEEELVALVRAAERAEALARFVQHGGGEASLVRLDFPVPRRDGMPPPERYARLGGRRRERPAGYVEASRGCLHLCRHCPIPPVYGGRFFVVPVETVLADMEQQVAAGATHVTFGDPDFLNGPGACARHRRGSARRRFPELTFDFTAKVEHLVKASPTSCRARGLGAHLRRLGGRVALGSRARDPRQGALAGRRRGCFQACGRAGIPLRPTLRPLHALDHARRLSRAPRPSWAAGARSTRRSGAVRAPPPRAARLAARRGPELALEGLDGRRSPIAGRTPIRAWTCSGPGVGSSWARRARGDDPFATCRGDSAIVQRLAARRTRFRSRPSPSPSGGPRPASPRTGSVERSRSRVS